MCSVDRIEKLGINLDWKKNDSLSESSLESDEDKKPPGKINMIDHFISLFIFKIYWIKLILINFFVYLANWPQYGKIVFENVEMRYYQNESPVLKNLNFTIEENDKIGVVGRTGAGKLIIYIS